MNKFIQHVPTFVQLGEYPPAFEFETQEQLIEHLDSICNSNEKFYRYSLSDNTVMEEKDNGKLWWVLGYLKSLDSIDLPTWEPK